MKRLVIFDLTADENYPGRGPERTSFVPEEFQAEIPTDWREEVLNASEALGWDMTTSEIESVETMLDFLIAHEPSYSNCVRRSDVQLPGGVVLLDSTVTGKQEPLMLLWEEEGVSDRCDGCCKLLRKECPGKTHTELTFSQEGSDPDCYEKCGAERMEDCPYLHLEECAKPFQHLPDGVDIDDFL